VLVTGGSGFVGRHLIQTLLGLGHEVRCFDIVPANHDPRVEFVQGDLTAEDDQPALAEACADVDTVFHTASLTDPQASFAAIWRVNVLGTQRVLRACLDAGVRNLIYTSTTAVIFNGRDIEGATEDECAYPRSFLDPYSQCKAEAEQLVVAANGQVTATGQRLCTVSLRPHAIFGPRDTHFISKLIARARNGDITHMIGKGVNKVMSFTRW
jgi:nucleoside-diphosphate-sugar epimerase